MQDVYHQPYHRSTKCYRESGLGLHNCKCTVAGCLGFRGLGFRGLGFRGLGFKVEGSLLRVAIGI